MLVMVAYPIGRIVYLSFTQNILTRPELGVSFIGLANYVQLFSSAEFWVTMGRTALWTFLSVAGKTVLGFGIAWLLAKEMGFKKVYIFLLLIPWATPMVVAAVAWRWIFDGQFGMLNYILVQTNIITEHIIWLGEAATAFIATAITDMWIGLPFMVLVLLAGLQSVAPRSESAAIDGANAFHQLRRIILPVMKPIILVATTLSTIWTFNSFGVIWPMTRGGPVDATRTLVVDAYIRAPFGAFDLGRGATIAVCYFYNIAHFHCTLQSFANETRRLKKEVFILWHVNGEI